jgi:hypothetical protein
MKKYKLLLTTISLFSCAISNVRAECAAPRTPIEELKRVSAVFSAEVTGTERKKIIDSNSKDFGGERLFIEMKVNRWWKGDRDKNIILLRTSVVYFRDTTRRNGDDFRFTPGESYLVYAFYADGEFRTNACTRTRKMSKAEKDIQELGEGFPPIKADEGAKWIF